MKRIKVIATLFIMFSASLMNYHNHSLSSVNFSTGSEMVRCADSKKVSATPAPANHNYKAAEIIPCRNLNSDNTGKNQKMPSGKNYEAMMVIM